MSCKTETAKNVIKFIGMYLERSPFRENCKPSCQKMHCKGHHHCFFPWRHFCEFYKRHCFISQTYPFADVIQNRWSWKFCEIQKKTPLLESLVTQHVGSTQNFENFLWVTFFTEHLTTTASNIMSIFVQINICLIVRIHLLFYLQLFKVLIYTQK